MAPGRVDTVVGVLTEDGTCAPQLFGADVNQSIARLVDVQCDMIE